MHPALSSVAHPLEERAERALDLLWGKRKAQPVNLQIHCPHLDRTRKHGAAASGLTD